MAFNRNSNTAPAAQNDSWKSAGFLNLYLPSKDGGRVKLGAIGLKEGRPNEKRLLDWLNEDPSRADALLTKLEVEYRSAEPAEGSAIDLPV